MSERSGMRNRPPSPKVTPPGSLIELPPSPPSTGRLHESRGRVEAFVRLIKRGGSIELSSGDFTTISDRLRETDLRTWGWLQDKPRLELIDGKHLSRRMPTPVHEFVAQKLGDAFKEGLQSMKRSCNPVTKRLIDDTLPLGSADVKFAEGWCRSPDQQFKIRSLPFPGIVYEVAYAQTPSGLARAGKDYIVESYGRVQKVVGLKFDPASLDASLTVWCPTLEVEDGITLVGYKKSDSDQVRDGQGNALPGSLKLHLRDLGPQTELDRLYPGAQLDKGVEITYGEIVGYIREAEHEQETVRDIPAPPANTRKRPRSESSADDLDSADEREYKRVETKTDDASFAGDKEYGD